MLKNRDIPFISLDDDTNNVTLGRELGYSVHFDKMSDPEILKGAGLSDARAVVVTMEDPHEAERVIRNIRVLYPSVPIYASTRGREISRPRMLCWQAGSVASSCRRQSQVFISGQRYCKGPVFRTVIAKLSSRTCGATITLLSEAPWERDAGKCRQRIADLQLNNLGARPNCTRSARGTTSCAGGAEAWPAFLTTLLRWRTICPRLLRCTRAG